MCNEDIIQLNSKSKAISSILESSDAIELKPPTDFMGILFSSDGQESLINESFEVSLASSVYEEGSADAHLNDIANDQELYDHSSEGSSENKVWLTKYFLVIT